MAKRNEVNDGDLFFVEHHKGLSDVELSSKLNLKVSAVRQLREQTGKTSVKVTSSDLENAVTTIKKEEVQSEAVAPKRGVGNKFITQTPGGRKGITIMTPGASEMVDENRKNLPQTSDRVKKAIHKPFG